MRVCYEFEVKPGSAAAFEGFYFAAMLPHLQQVPGFQEEVLLRLRDSDGHYMIVGQWASFELFDRWRNTPEHQVAVRGLVAFFTTRPQIRIYEHVERQAQSLVA